MSRIENEQSYKSELKKLTTENRIYLVVFFSSVAFFIINNLDERGLLQVYESIGISKNTELDFKVISGIITVMLAPISLFGLIENDYQKASLKQMGIALDPLVFEEINQQEKTKPTKNPKPGRRKKKK